MIRKTIALTSSRQITLPSALIKMIGAKPGSRLIATYDEKADVIRLSKQKTLDETFSILERLQDEELKNNPEAARRTRINAGKTANELREIFEESLEGKKYMEEKYND